MPGQTRGHVVVGGFPSTPTAMAEQFKMKQRKVSTRMGVGEWLKSWARRARKNKRESYYWSWA